MKSCTYALTLLLLLALPLGCAPDTTDAPPTDPAAADADTSERSADDEETGGETTEAEPDAARDEAAGAGVDVFTHEPAQQGGTLVIGETEEPDSLYAFGTTMAASSLVWQTIYTEPTLQVDFDIQPWALESLPRLEQEGSGAALELVAVEPGEFYVDEGTGQVLTATARIEDLPQLTVRYTFRDGLKWEDGTPVTAADSVFTSEVWCHPDTPMPKYLCDRTERYEAIDELTVEWKGLPGYTDQFYFANAYWPGPRHQPGADGRPMAEMTPAEMLYDEEFNRRPYSSGPFKLVEWESGDHITLDRNEHYWRADEGLPYLDRIVIKYMPDSNALFAALKSGEVDVAQLPIEMTDVVEAASTDGELEPHYYQQQSLSVLNFNLNPVDERIAFGACPEFRKAVALGIDRQAMVDVFAQGEGEVHHSVVPVQHWAFPPEGELTRYDYDPAAAKALLDDLGLVDTDGDGVREAAHAITCTITVDMNGSTKDHVIPEGTPAEVTMIYSSTPAVEDQVLFMQQQLQDIGLLVNLKGMQVTALLDDAPDGPLNGRRYDLARFGWSTGVMPPLRLFACDSIPHEGNAWAGNNMTGWCDPDYDRAASLGQSTISRDEALQYYHEAQRIFAEGLPALPLYSELDMIVSRPGIVNINPYPTGGKLWNLDTWGYAEE